MSQLKLFILFFKNYFTLEELFLKNYYKKNYF